MSERKPPSKSTAGPLPVRIHTAMRRAASPVPTVRNCSIGDPILNTPRARLLRIAGVVRSCVSSHQTQRDLTEGSYTGDFRGATGGRGLPPPPGPPPRRAPDPADHPPPPG